MGSDKRGNSFGSSRRSLFGTEGSEVGLLLLGFALKPLYLNPASLRILVYPETAKAVMERDRLDRKIRSVLLVDPPRIRLCDGVSFGKEALCMPRFFP